MLVPKGKTLPEIGVQVRAGLGSQLSVVVVVKLTIAPFGDAQNTMMLLGHPITGGTTSGLHSVVGQQ